jgi:hypothetical protein
MKWRRIVYHTVDLTLAPFDYFAVIVDRVHEWLSWHMWDLQEWSLNNEKKGDK